MPQSHSVGSSSSLGFYSFVLLLSISVIYFDTIVRHMKQLIGVIFDGLCMCIIGGIIWRWTWRVFWVFRNFQKYQYRNWRFFGTSHCRGVFSCCCCQCHIFFFLFGAVFFFDYAGTLQPKRSVAKGRWCVLHLHLHHINFISVNFTPDQNQVKRKRQVVPEVRSMASVSLIGIQ